MRDVWSDALATLVYPGLAAVSLFWAHIGVARLIRTRRINDMEQRLHNIEDALITMQTVLNLLLDLLAQAIPPTEEDPDSGTSEGDA